MATAIETLPGIHEVGQLPESFPPIVFVRFEVGQTSTEAIVEAAKIALETDPYDATTVAVRIEAAEVEASAILAPVMRFPAADLWVTRVESSALRLNSESFSCGTCLSQATHALGQAPGVLETQTERFPDRTVVVTVTYDPSVIGAEEIGQIVAKAIEADELLQQTVTVYHLGPN